MRIGEIRDPNLFQRLVRTLFATQYGKAFHIVDDSRGDRGNDGYDSEGHSMFAVYCPEKESTEKSLLKKGREDLAKAVGLKSGGDYVIEEWVFVTPTPLPERVQAKLRAECEDAGMRAAFVANEHLEPMFLGYPHVHELFPELTYPRVKEELERVNQKLDRLLAEPERATPPAASAIPPIPNREEPATGFAVALFPGFTSDRLADIQRRLWSGQSGVVHELERYRLEASSERERLAALMVEIEWVHEKLEFDAMARLGQMGERIAMAIDAKAEGAVFKAKRAFAMNQLLVQYEMDFQARLEMSVKAGVPLVSAAEAAKYDATISGRHQEVEDLYAQAYESARGSRNLFALFATALLYGTSRTHLAFIYKMPGRERRTPDLAARIQLLKGQVEASYDLAISIATAIGSKQFLAMAYSNFANDLRFFDDTARALSHATHALSLALEVGDESQIAKTRTLIERLKSP